MDVRIRSVLCIASCLLFLISGCTSIFQLRASRQELTLIDILSLFDKDAETLNRLRIARIRPDSLDVLTSRYWVSRDPTPETSANEYRDRLRARFETGKYRYTPAHESGPDDRIIPFVLYGEPVHIYRYPGTNSDVTEIWTYAPRGNIETPDFWLLPEIGFRVGFEINDESRYRLDPAWFGGHAASRYLSIQEKYDLIEYDKSRYRSDPARFRVNAASSYLPIQEKFDPLEIDEALELERTLLADTFDMTDREDVVWCLGVDPGYNGLGVLLRNLNIEVPLLRSKIQKALHPLRVFSEAGSSTKTVWERGGSTTTAIWSRPPRPSTDPVSDPTLLANKILLVYSPTHNLPPAEVLRLTHLRDQSDSLRFSHGWLSPEDAARVFSGSLQIARDMIESEQFVEAYEYLKPLLRAAYSASAEAWHLNALALIESIEPGGRRMAENAIRQAMRLNPGNLRYHLSLARIYYKRTFDRYAERRLNQILKRAPYVADAHALKAVMRLEYYWASGWKAGGWGTPLNEMSMDSEEYLNGTLSLLNSALILDPVNPTATWWLGLHQMKTGDWIGAVQVMSYLINKDIHRGEALMGRGLALQHLGFLDMAASDYESGLTVLTPNIRVIADNPRWLIAPSAGGHRLDERTDSNKGILSEGEGSGNDLNQTIETFWQQRDPLFSTSRNERIIEQHRRLAHVIWHFARPDLGMKGWETHRGQVYLRYGEPLQDFSLTRQEIQRKIRAQLGYIPGLDSPIFLPGSNRPISNFPNMMPIPSISTWIYPGFEVRFRGGWVTGYVRLSNPKDYEILNEIVATSNHIVGFPEVRLLSADWYAFLDDERKPEYVSIADISPLQTIAIGESGSISLDYSVNLLLLDSEWKVIHKIGTTITPARIPRGLHGQWISPFVRPTSSVDVSSYANAALEIIGDGNMTAYASRDSLPEIVQDGLGLSSLVMATEIGSLIESRHWSTGSFFVRGDRAIVPMSEGSYLSEIPLSLYFEVYGLTRDEHGATNYEITFTITAIDRARENLPFIEALFGTLLGRHERQDSVSMIFAYSGIKEGESQEFRTVFPQAVTTGRYLIAIEIHDRVAGTSTIRTKVIGQPK